MRNFFEVCDRAHIADMSSYMALYLFDYITHMPQSYLSAIEGNCSGFTLMGGLQTLGRSRVTRHDLLQVLAR